MKFYGTPNHFVRVKSKGRLKNVKSFRFDANGEFETDNVHLIEKLKLHFETSNELSEDEIRQLAKDNGIKSWHVKSIETLKKELGV